MTTSPSKYYPRSREFHDLLEVLATEHNLAQMRLEGAVQHRSAVIADVLTQDCAEYLSISTGETFRLDRPFRSASMGDCFMADARVAAIGRPASTRRQRT